MKFTVLWTPVAEARLAKIWLYATNRNVVSSAVHQIDELLARDPELLGEFVFDTVRRFSLPPLGVEYEVVDVDRIINVLNVWTE